LTERTWRRLGFQHLEVAGQPVADLHNYQLLWTVTPEGPSAHVAVLYYQGRRVVEAWRLVLAADQDKDPWGSSA
jgi:hypothetical protein